MKTHFVIGLLCSISNVGASAAAEFETESWPGEGVPVLIAVKDNLLLYTQPRSDAATRSIPYKAGWRVPFDETIYRTVRSSWIEVKNTGTVLIWCNEDRSQRFMAGDTIEYLQYRAEGTILARIEGEICEVPLYLEEDVFGTEYDDPTTEWWTRVIYRDGSSPGWLLTTDGQVSLNEREF